jgi:hypothetical protein
MILETINNLQYKIHNQGILLDEDRSKTKKLKKKKNLKPEE